MNGTGNARKRSGNVMKWSATLSMMVMAASCSGQTTMNMNKPPDSEPVSSEKDWTKEPVELTFYYMYNEDFEKDFRQGDGARILKKYPNITLKFLKNAGNDTGRYCRHENENRLLRRYAIRRFQAAGDRAARRYYGSGEEA